MKTIIELLTQYTGEVIYEFLHDSDDFVSVLFVEEIYYIITDYEGQFEVMHRDNYDAAMECYETEIETMKSHHLKIESNG